MCGQACTSAGDVRDDARDDAGKTMYHDDQADSRARGMVLLLNRSQVACSTGCSRGLSGT